MFKLCREHKVMRDPVHGYIHVDYQVIWDLINAPEFQRLRRIHQLGGTYQVYHTAEHSRFSHSLGVYEVVRLMIENIKGLKAGLSELEHVALLCAGLLHDIGHGPFSHAFEAVTAIHHEVFTDRIILEETHIHTILCQEDSRLPQLIADIIAHRCQRKLLSQIISSQLDADRMDYLLRDSYFTGVSYGEFDLYRILRTIRIVDDVLVVKESGIHAIEDYIMARYQMYWQVYLHPTSRSYEVILQAIFKRMKNLYDQQPAFRKELAFFEPYLSGSTISLSDHFQLDETSCLAQFMKLASSRDELLADLVVRMLNRNLFKYQDSTDPAVVDRIKSQVIAAGFDPDYYLMQDSPTQELYSPYIEESDSRIWVLKDTKVVELSHASMIVKGFVLGKNKQDHKVFYPKEVAYE